jgi:hypothetical protein
MPWRQSQRRGIAHVVWDINDDEVESKTTREEPKEHVIVEERMIKEINGIGGKPKLDTPVYYGSLNPEELIDWIGEMENFFEFENIRDPRRVRFSNTN